jgi:hypothetical protein
MKLDGLGHGILHYNTKQLVRRAKSSSVLFPRPPK